MTTAFCGFTPEAFQFLVDLAQNNERAWFQPRKADYERLLKAPLEALCATLDAEFTARAVPLTADPAHSPFRIYRDVRFARDKSPYKTYVSASFPWAGEGGGVGGYVHLQPGEVYIGGGMWHPSPARLAAWRAAVIADRTLVHGVLGDAAFVRTFGAVDGDRLRRAPTGFRADDPDVDLLRLKDVTIGRHLPDTAAMTPDLATTIADTLIRATPLLGLLAALPGHEAPVGWLRT